MSGKTTQPIVREFHGEDKNEGPDRFEKVTLWRALLVDTRIERVADSPLVVGGMEFAFRIAKEG